MADCNCSVCRPFVSGAKRRARALLLSFLDDNQQKQLAEGFFTLVGSDGRTYRINTSTYSGNVWLLGKSGAKMKSYCCYPNYRFTPVPMDDLILGQLLALKTNAEEFVRTARY